MKTKQTEPYFDKLVEVRVTFMNDVCAIGEMIAQELIAPICQKYKLRFVSGMSTC